MESGTQLKTVYICSVGFPTGQDVATFPGTAGQAQNFATGQDRLGFCHLMYRIVVPLYVP